MRRVILASEAHPNDLPALPVTGGVWAISIALVVLVYAVDFWVASRNPHVPTVREAGRAVVIVIVLALLFGVALWVWASGVDDPAVAEHSGQYALQYLAGYITELSLSVDNLFVFMIIMSTFAVPAIYQMKVLQIGIIGALVLRFAFILVAGAALAAFSWLFYVFGAFLIYTGIKLATSHGIEGEPEDNAILRFVERVLPTTTEYHEDRFVVRIDGVRTLTPMFIVIVAIFASDIMFALDSIPAIFGLTSEAYIVIMANAFALMGLRQMYFLLDGLLDRLVYLTKGLAVILGFIGVKLILTAMYNGGLIDWHISTGASLAVIVGVLVITVLASVVKMRRDRVTGEL